MSPENLDERLIKAYRQEATPSAGLTLDCAIPFPVGSLVILDLDFPEHFYKYRSRGLVSWTVPSANDSHSFKVGVLIFEMEKLDSAGAVVSTSIMPPPQSPTTIAKPVPKTTSTSVSLFHESDPIDEAVIPPEVSGELLALCNLNDKIGGWMYSHQQFSPGHLDQRPTLTLQQSHEAITENQSEIEIDVEVTDPSHISESRAQEEPEITVIVEFNAEEKMIQAFEKMYGLYQLTDRDEAAAFTLNLARDLILSEAGLVSFVSNKKLDLQISAQEQLDESITGQHISISNTLMGESVQTGGVIFKENPSSTNSFREKLDKAIGIDTKNLLIVPIQADTQTIGAMELINSPRKHGFVQEEANLLAYVAIALAEYLEKLQS